MAYGTATLTGTYKTFDDQPASGVVEIIPNSRSLVDAEGDVILAGRVKVTLDATGSFTVVLPATDDTTVEPATGRQYTVVAKLRHTHLPAVTGVELATGATVNVADVASTPTVDATVTPGATLAQLDALETTVTTHTARTDNPHAVTKTQVGLANVDDVSAAALRDRSTHTGTQPVASITGLADVATTGAYTDLTGTPTIPTTPEQVAAEPAGLSTATETALAATYETVVWERASTSPVSPPVAAGTVNMGFADVWADGNTLHMFGMVTGGGTPGIYHSTSTDGETWTAPTLALGPGTQTWENTEVGVPCVWKEGATWHMQYRGTGTGSSAPQVGYATAAAPQGPWTRAQATPVITTAMFGGGTGCETGPGRVIKIGGTYYAHVSGFGLRTIKIFTSTDLITWTVHPDANPAWVGARFCNCVWKDGNSYFSLVPKYRAYGTGGTATGDSEADIELWRSSSPVFKGNARANLGMVLRAGVNPWETKCLDTPTVVFDTITKDSYPAATSNEPWVFYAGNSGTEWRTGLVRPRLRRTFPAVDPTPVPAIAGTWALDAMPATRAATWIYRLGDTTSTRKFVRMPRSGTITAMSILGSTKPTAGIATAVLAYDTGVGAGLTVKLGTNGTEAVAAAPPGGIQFSAGATFGIVLDSAGVSPASINVTVELLVTFDPY